MSRLTITVLGTTGFTSLSKPRVKGTHSLVFRETISIGRDGSTMYLTRPATRSTSSCVIASNDVCSLVSTLMSSLSENATYCPLASMMPRFRPRHAVPLRTAKAKSSNRNRTFIFDRPDNISRVIGAAVQNNNDLIRQISALADQAQECPTQHAHSVKDRDDHADVNCRRHLESHPPDVRIECRLNEQEIPGLVCQVPLQPYVGGPEDMAIPGPDRTCRLTV